MIFQRDKSGKLKITFSLKGNSSVNFPIICSFVGLFFSMIILLPQGCDKKKYHNLYLTHKKELVDSILQRRILKLTPIYTSLLPFNPAKDSMSKRDSFNKVKTALMQAQTELYHLHNTNPDTSLSYYMKYFSVDRDALYKSLTGLKDSKNYKLPLSIPIIIRDTPIFISDLPVTHKAVLKIDRKEKTLVSFAATYPAFGFWFFLSVAQMTLWFLILALAMGSILKTQGILSDYPYNFKNALISFILPCITLVIFIILFYEFVIDEHVIIESYFLKGFNCRMVWYSIPGYIVAIFCFSTYLFLSNKLELLDTISKSEDEKAKKNIQPDSYEKLKAAFDFSFYCSAFILSLFVFYLGILFNATNGIEAMRFYTLLSGKPFLSYDFVYLVGLMHSLLLLIFYVPVRLRFNALQLTKDVKTTRDTSEPKKYLRILLDNLGSVLITVSPLIATLVEKIITALL